MGPQAKQSKQDPGGRTEEKGERGRSTRPTEAVTLQKKKLPEHFNSYPCKTQGEARTSGSWEIHAFGYKELYIGDQVTQESLSLG